MLGMSLHTRLIIMKAGPCSITYQISNYRSVVGEERGREKIIKSREGKASKIPRIKKKKKINQALYSDVRNELPVIAPNNKKGRDYIVCFILTQYNR